MIGLGTVDPLLVVLVPPVEDRGGCRIRILRPKSEIPEQIPEDRLIDQIERCLLYTSPSPRDVEESRMPSSA